MKRALWPAILFVVSLSGAALGARAVAQGDDPPPPPAAPAPSPFEYRVFVLDYREFKDKDDYRDEQERAGGNELKADAAFKARVLNFLAKEGWELVQVLAPKPELTHFYLRRTRPDARR